MRLFNLTLLLTLLSLSLVLPTAIQSAPFPNKSSGVNIVLVHGAFADGSCWSNVIPILQLAGHTVRAVQQGLTSTPTDVATTRTVMESLTGPIILVGHSFGGLTITEAGRNASNVAALVYVAGAAPEENEPLGELGTKYASLPSVASYIPDSQGRIRLPQDKFVEYFAPDVVPKSRARAMAATQGPIDAVRFEYILQGVPAWKDHAARQSNYYIIPTLDQIIDPVLQLFFATRMNATVFHLKSSHAVMVSHPIEVAKVILLAASKALA